MTHLEPEDILRRALHAAAESVEPATDGLAQIRARLSTPRPLAVAWLIAGWETVAQFVMTRLEPALAKLMSRLRAALRAADGRLYPVTERLRPVAEWLRPALAWLVAAVTWLHRMIKPSQAGSDDRPSRSAWVRPVIAMAAVVLVAIAGGFALSGLPHQIEQAAQSVFSTTPSGGSGGGSHTPGVTGSGTPYTPTPGASGRHGTSPTPSSSCTPKPKPKATPKVSPTSAPTTQAPTPSPPSTPTSTSTPTPSPSTPSPTTSTNLSTQTAPASQSAAPATQSAQVSVALFIGGGGSGTSASPSPTPSAC